MTSLRDNTVETVNAAATAIVTAETRVQPSSAPKKRWGNCWSLYWCFGSTKNNKRIGHGVLASEPAASGSAVPASDSLNSSSTTVVMPFIAPPSSPASFLQSDPSSANQSPAEFISLASLSFNTSNAVSSMFTIGPYAHETQLVSPPVFSAFTTEPSTANFTPPPEPMQFTTPSSPEVPFAQLLASSLAGNRRQSSGAGANIKFPLSQYDYQPYQCPGSPGSRLISPGSVVSNSGTSSPFPEKRPIIEIRIGEAPKFLGYEYFTRKRGSRVGSGSMTPNGWGGSRLGSGSLTPNGGISRLGSGAMTPTGGEAYLMESQISEVASLANSENGSNNEEQQLVDHRVSFEVNPNCLKEAMLDTAADGSNAQDAMADKNDGCHQETINKTTGANSEGEENGCVKLDRDISVGSSKDFNFDSMKQEIPEKPAIDCDWWTNDKVATKEIGSQNKWNFFPMLQPGVS